MNLELQMHLAFDACFRAGKAAVQKGVYESKCELDFMTEAKEQALRSAKTQTWFGAISFIAFCFTLVALMIATSTAHAATVERSCEWSNPGADRYTGTPAAAIDSMRDIPRAVKAKLIERANRNQFDGQIVIRANRIEGNQAFHPEVRQMVFGSKGRTCDQVTRKSWSDTHAEFAMVFCESGFCVARPSICNNWFVATLKSPVAASAGLPESPQSAPTSGGGGLVPIEPVIAVAADPAVPMSSVIADADPESNDGRPFVQIQSFGFAPIGYGGSVVVLPAATAPVPEPISFVLLLGGLVFVAIVILGTKRK